MVKAVTDPCKSERISYKGMQTLANTTGKTCAYGKVSAMESGKTDRFADMIGQ